MAYNILGVGSPCVDIIYQVDDQFLLDNNIKKGDGKSTSWEHFSLVLENAKVKGYLPLISTGGSTANTMKGLARLKEKAAFYGKIGDDSFAKFFETNISEAGIIPLLTKASLPTSQIAVFVTSDHERSFLSFAGANRLIAKDPFSDTLFKGVKLLHIEGYMIDELGIPYVEHLMKHAKANNVDVSIDMGCPRIAKTYAEEIIRLLRSYVKITFANHNEVAALLGLTPKEGCKKIAELSEIAVIGIGKEGCFVGSNKKLFQSEAIKVQAIDTTGAGDLFACGFLYGHLNGYSLEVSAKIGNVLGGTVVTHLGAEIPAKEWPKLIKTIDSFASA